MDTSYKTPISSLINLLFNFVLAPPAFIVPLQPYTGALYNSKYINISCRVECSPICSVSWLKDGRPIDNSHRYTVSKVNHNPDLRTNDFESIQSILVSKYLILIVLVDLNIL